MQTSRLPLLSKPRYCGAGSGPVAPQVPMPLPFGSAEHDGVPSSCLRLGSSTLLVDDERCGGSTVCDEYLARTIEVQQAQLDNL